MDAKRVAAVAGVLAYLREKAGGRAPSSSGPGVSLPSPWALYGRQALMSQRIRMQARRRA
jgi:hypothetical protein